MAKKFTFQTSKPSGRYRGFFPTFYYVKLDGKKIGQFSNQDLTIRLMVNKADINEDGNPNCSWKWIALKKQSSSVEEVKEFLMQNAASILEKYDIRMEE